MSRTMAGAAVENIVKQGYLRRVNATNRFSSFFRRQEGSKWFVLTVRDGVPFLEQYDANVDVFSRPPLHSFSLAQCIAVRSQGTSSSSLTFLLVCPDRVLELVATNRRQLNDWVEDVEKCLVDLGIIKNARDEHVYSVCPAVVRKPRGSEEDGRESEDQRLQDSSSVALSSLTTGASAGTPVTDSTLPQQSTDRSGTAGASSLALPDSESSNRHSGGEVEWMSSRDLPPSLPPKSATLGHSSRRQTPPRITAFEAVTRRVSGSSLEDLQAAPPPPLPFRPNARSSTSELVPADEEANGSRSHTISNSSNDSDFVSPDVIAQIRNSRILFKFDSDLDKGQSDGAQSSDVLPVVPQDGNAYSSVNKSASSCAKRASECLSLDEMYQSNPIKTKASEPLPESSSSPEFSLNSSISSSCSSLDLSLDMDKLLAPVSSSSNQAAENPYSFLPAHNGACALPQTSASHSSESDPDLKCSLTGTGIKPIPRPRLQSRHSQENSASFPRNSDSDSTGPTQLFGDDFINSMFEWSGDVVPNENVDEKLEENGRKDENENFYGHMSEASTSDAPPIPPLPPRYDSLSLLEGEIKNMSQTSQPASRTLAIPPIPQPRKHTVKTRGVSLEIPPIPPRRGPLLHSKTVEDSHSSTDVKAPALPTRSSQSFFIRRPQLTAVNPSLEDAAALAFDSSELPPAEVGPDNEFGANKGSHRKSGLSQKMQLDRAHSLHTVVSLKQTQAEILQSQIAMPSIAITLTQKSGYGLALVDWDGLPCVVGWNQQDFPSLHGKLHLGDQLVSINGVRVNAADVAQKLLRNATTPKITVVLHRMPLAKVFAIRREAEGQSLGIKREGGTGEIIYVDRNGLAAQYGLPPYAQGARGEQRCNWFITEINNRPISLFFKENEIEHRLAAVGREISIVVQPSDFIYEIRRLFKKVKNYKSFVTT